MIPVSEKCHLPRTILIKTRAKQAMSLAGHDVKKTLSACSKLVGTGKEILQVLVLALPLPLTYIYTPYMALQVSKAG